MSFCKWFSNNTEENFYTPDLPEIYRSESHYVFIANNLMATKPKGSWSLCEDGVSYLGKGFTSTATYGIMICKSAVEPDTPLYFEVVANKESAFIYGDIYEVPPEAMLTLDYEHANRLVTKRKKISVVTRKDHKIVNAWAWLGDLEYFNTPRTQEKLQPYVNRNYLWNVPVIAWGQSIFST